MNLIGVVFSSTFSQSLMAGNVFLVHVRLSEGHDFLQFENTVRWVISTWQLTRSKPSWLRLCINYKEDNIFWWKRRIYDHFRYLIFSILKFGMLQISKRKYSEWIKTNYDRNKCKSDAKSKSYIYKWFLTGNADRCQGFSFFPNTYFQRSSCIRFWFPLLVIYFISDQIQNITLTP